MNSELPFMAGDAELPAGAFSHILESNTTDFPLFAPPKEPIGPVQYAIGLQVARLLPDGGTLQIGIGRHGDAAAQAMILRHLHNTAFREAVQGTCEKQRAGHALYDDRPFATGLYGVSEMLVDPFLALIKAGVIKREG